MEVKINGITYESKPSEMGCSGCVAYCCNDSLCTDLPDDCSYPPIIWIKKENNEGVMMQETNEEPKYTVDEVLEAIESIHGPCWCLDDVIEIKEYLAKQNNPDYQLYLKLKEQFGE